MNKGLLWDYISIFNEEIGVPENNYTLKEWYLDLDEEYLCSMQDELGNRLLKGATSENNPEDIPNTALIMYGYRMGAVRLKSKNECINRQNGYQDNAIWNYNLDELLNSETDVNNSAASVSNLINWIINPRSNIDISDGMLRKMIIPMIKTLSKVIPPKKKNYCTVVIPPVSIEFEYPNWKELFANTRLRETQITVVDYGEMFEIGDEERVYICIHQTDGMREYLIISAYEFIRGSNRCIGSLAFDINENEQYTLQNVKKEIIEINSHRENYDKEDKEIVKHNWEYIDNICPINSGFNSFLGNHSASFLRKIYRLNKKTEMGKNETAVIRNTFSGSEALQVFEVCSKLLKERNLCNLSLGDMVYAANLLERDKAFEAVSVNTNKSYELGTFNGIAQTVDINKIKNIPSNYATFTWKLKNSRISVVPYYGLDMSKHTAKQIIESIVDYYKHCTTENIADDIMYMHTKEDPSAYFTAKIFLFLSTVDTIEIESRNEIVQNVENVDVIEYKEIDKSLIKVQDKKSIKIVSNKLIKTNITIEDLGFTVRTYNCLKRARIMTLHDIANKTPQDMMKVRNMGRSNVEEVVRVLKKHGLALNQ